MRFKRRSATAVEFRPVQQRVNAYWERRREIEP